MRYSVFKTCLLIIGCCFAGVHVQADTPPCRSVRERINLDEGWRFHLGHATDPSKDFNFGTTRLYGKTAENYGTCINPKFDDSAWAVVDVPHDWAVGLPFEYTKKGEAWSHGYKPIGGYYPQNSVGWYRKRFEMPAADTTRRVVLTFDGIFRNSQVWVNNFYLGAHFSGYTGTSYDITDVVRYDADNLIVVRVDASQVEGWFYEGAGIYRHVWLHVFDRLGFTENGIFVTAQLNGDYSQAVVNIASGVESFIPEPVDLRVETTVYDNRGREVSKARSAELRLAADGKATVNARLTIERPSLWDIDSPHLYRAVSVLTSGGVVKDRVETRFGVRDIRIDCDKGLSINGRPIKIQGVCCHQDHAGVGSALPDYLQYYRIKLLKEMGANAYRASHNPPTPELLDACDSLGMLVVDETRLTNSGREYMEQFEDLVLRDRNHPCIFMWSIGNEEETLQSKREGRNIALSMMRRLRQLDPTRPATYGANNGNTLTGINEVIDVRGFNYNLGGIDPYRKARPDQPLYGSELGSTVTTRGVYKVDSVKNYLTDFDENYPPWASTAETWWRMAAERDWFMGGFVWTGFDYRGEPTPFEWPNINSHFGVMDMCGFPKNIYYYYQSWWTDKDVLHIAPHWNWSGREGEDIRVWVNSNAQSVELFLNGKSLGEKEMPRNGHLEWMVPYRPGKLKAVARKNGRTFDKTVETTARAEALVLTPDRSVVTADGKDGTVINVEVRDDKGRLVPDAGHLIHFAVSDDAKIIGVGNGDPSCHEPDQYPDGRWQRTLFNGKCQILVQAGKTTGRITVSAYAADLEKAQTIITQK